MMKKCTHPTVIPDDGSARYFHCLDCHRTLRMIQIAGPFGREAYKFVAIGERDVS